MKKNVDDLPHQVQRELLAMDEIADEDIDTSDIPEVLDWSRAERGRFYRPTKQQITLRIDADVIAWFKAQLPQCKGYQTNINPALREHVRRSTRRLARELEHFTVLQRRLQWSPVKEAAISAADLPPTQAALRRRRSLPGAPAPLARCQAAMPTISDRTDPPTSPTALHCAARVPSLLAAVQCRLTVIESQPLVPAKLSKLPRRTDQFPSAAHHLTRRCRETCDYRQATQTTSWSRRPGLPRLHPSTRAVDMRFRSSSTRSLVRSVNPRLVLLTHRPRTASSRSGCKVLAASR